MKVRPSCPHCGIDSVRQAKGSRNGKTQFQCNVCERYFTIRNINLSEAKILVFDIETAPNSGYVWNLWKQNVFIDQIISDWFCLTWSAKWLYDDEVMSAKLTSKEAKNEDDKRILQKLWDLVDEANIIIAHNGDGFDIPRINTRFLIHGLPPPSSYQSIDTLKMARKHFAFNSNKLDNICRLLGIPQKTETNFKLWKRCVNGENKALQEMLDYNINDTFILEEVYLRLRSWMKSHPNLALYTEDEEPMCPCCASKNLRPKGEYYTQVGRYSTYHCNDCGSIARARRTEIKLEKRKRLLVSPAR